MTIKQITRIIVLQIIILSFLQIAIAYEQITAISRICRKSENVSTTGIYHDNINTLFDTLTNQSSNSTFFETSSGTGVDRVNGLYVCRPDLSLDTCNSCVDTAVGILKQRCSNKKQAIAWFEECMVRYTNLTISATLKLEPSNAGVLSFFTVSQPETFTSIRNKTLEAINIKASNNKDHYAFDSTTYTSFEGFHGMAWCTPDITSPECQKCLDNALNEIIPAGGFYQSAFAINPNCILMYDTAPFIFPTSSSPLDPADR